MAPVDHYLRIRLINNAGTTANVYYTNGIKSTNERVGRDMIEEIKPRIDKIAGVIANYTVTATSEENNAPLYINGREQIIAAPTTEKIFYDLYINNNKGILNFLIILMNYLK